MCPGNTFRCVYRRSRRDSMKKKKKDTAVNAASRANVKLNPQNNVKLAAPLKAVLTPFEHFIKAETSSGTVLLSATILALLWANLFPKSYLGFWNTWASIIIGPLRLDHTFAEWVNDGLMSVFFLQVGLELKREIRVGDLSTFGQAILPVVAAAGGMLVPALFFTICAYGSPYSHGWGIPMATDIAFALGVMTMLGRRVPTSLKVFLTALAVADDLGAVIVIALFYSGNLNVTAILAALIVFSVLILFNRLGVRILTIYSIGGVFLWMCILKSGIHASLAGVLLAISIPTWTSIDKDRLRHALATAEHALGHRKYTEEGALGDKHLRGYIELANISSNKAMPPLVIMERTISTFVSFIIMPVFALANSGVIVHQLDFGAFIADPVTHGIACGLILGKPIGIVLGTFITIKLGLAKVPRLASWSQLAGVGILGGIGFTMSLFVSNLALGNGAHLEVAKLAILCSSATAGILGFIWLYLHPQSNSDESSAKDIAQES